MRVRSIERSDGAPSIAYKFLVIHNTNHSVGYSGSALPKSADIEVLFRPDAQRGLYDPTVRNSFVEMAPPQVRGVEPLYFSHANGRSLGWQHGFSGICVTTRLNNGAAGFSQTNGEWWLGLTHHVQFETNVDDQFDNLLPNKFLTHSINGSKTSVSERPLPKQKTANSLMQLSLIHI